MKSVKWDRPIISSPSCEFSESCQASASQLPFLSWAFSQGSLWEAIKRKVSKPEQELPYKLQSNRKSRFTKKLTAFRWCLVLGLFQYRRRGGSGRIDDQHRRPGDGLGAGSNSGGCRLRRAITDAQGPRLLALVIHSFCRLIRKTTIIWLDYSSGIEHAITQSFFIASYRFESPLLSGSFQNSLDGRPLGSFTNWPVRLGCNRADSGARIPRLVVGIVAGKALRFDVAHRLLLGRIVGLIVWSVQRRINWRTESNL